MNSRFGLPDATIARIRGVLARYPQVQQAILYGSRALGTFKPGSDIDLTLRGRPAAPGTVPTGRQAARAGDDDLTPALLLKIMGDLDDLLLPYTIDLSIQALIDDADLLTHIERAGVVFYEATDIR